MEDVNLSDPFEKLKRGIFSTYDTFLQTTTSFKIQNSSNSNISTLKSSKTLFRAYQFKPLLKLLNSPNRRLLVADEVGLGKTIEAGHIMLELQARHELCSAIIVCPKSLQIKWRDELEDKFNLTFKVYDSIKAIIDDFRTQPKVLGIVNYEKMRAVRQKSDGSNDKRITFADFLQESGRNIDLMVCDEAHRLRNSETMTHKGIRELMNFTKAALFLTATPIMISRENLFNLLNLLNEAEYSSYPIFENALRVNQPFIAALSKLNNGVNLRVIADKLENAEVTTETQIGDYKYNKTIVIAERFDGIPLYHSIISTLRNAEDCHKTRVQLQFDISSLSKMNNIFSRTRKREVTQDGSQAERNPHTILVDLYPEEREEFDAVIEEYIADNTYVDEYGCDTMRPGTSLGLVQRKRQVASSVYGYLNDRDALASGIDRYADQPDGKFDSLLKVIDEVVNVNHKKLIIFALFHKTLEYLRLRLKKRGIKSAMIHGNIDEREEIISRFRDSDDINILLSSEVGSEGLDMQFCDALVNYDLPWNPMVVEQRIGRIDRFGQTSPKVNIYNIIVKDSIQEIIYDCLLNRIGIFRDSIGDLEAILDVELETTERGKHNLREYFSSLEKELYTTNLTTEERKRKVDDIARAIIHEKKNAEEISEKLTNSLTNDISFRNEIENILHRKQYVTGKELIVYMRQLINQKLSTCRLETEDEDKGIYKFILPKSTPRILTNFLSEYQPNDPEMAIELTKFRNRLREKTEIRLTFNQETAYANKGLMFVNAYHPFILTALEYFNKEKSGKEENTFRYILSGDDISSGIYCLALFEVRHKHTKYGVESISKTLLPILYDIKEQSIVEDDEVAKNIWGLAQEDAGIMVENPDVMDVDLMKIDFGEAIDYRDEQLYLENKDRLDSARLLDLQRAEEYFKSQIEHQKKIIRDNEYIAQSHYMTNEAKNAQRVLPALRGRLASLEEEKEREISRINAMSIERMSANLISLSIIHYKNTKL